MRKMPWPEVAHRRETWAHPGPRRRCLPPTLAARRSIEASGRQVRTRMLRSSARPSGLAPSTHSAGGQSRSHAVRLACRTRHTVQATPAPEKRIQDCDGVHTCQHSVNTLRSRSRGTHRKPLPVRAESLGLRRLDIGKVVGRYLGAPVAGDVSLAGTRGNTISALWPWCRY